ncbi:hypothetical protein JW916_14935, partial [Candidatus Sumerlaeota bacterium]|nr:hypothetical protein [Candidatus Sumerlaeota bacterium]
MSIILPFFRSFCKQLSLSSAQEPARIRRMSTPSSNAFQKGASQIRASQIRASRIDQAESPEYRKTLLSKTERRDLRLDIENKGQKCREQMGS